MTDEDELDEAARTGRWTPGLLDRVAPAQVVAAVLRSGAGWAELPGEVVARLSVAHRWDAAASHERGTLLDLARVRHGVPPRGAGAGASSGLRWADLARRPTHLTVATGCAGWTTAAVPLPDGRFLLAYHAEPRVLRLWDPATATVTATVRTRGAVTAFAGTVGPDGVPRLAVASGKAVQLYDPRTGKAVGGRIAGHDRTVRAVCWATLPDGRLVLATGGEDKAVRLWTATGTLIHELVQGGWNSGAAVSVVPWPQPDGAVLFATTWDGAQHRLRIVDASGALVGEREWVVATAAVLAAGRTLLATAGSGCQVELWEPGARTRLGEFRVDATHVSALAALPRPDGSTALVVPDGDDLRLFDPAAPGTSGARLLTRGADLRSVTALPVPGGRTVLAIVDDHDALRLWDPDVTDPAGFAPDGRALPRITAVGLPDGRVLAATSGDDGLLLRDADTGAPDGPPLLARDDRRGLVSAVRVADGRELVATDSPHGSVVLFDPVTREQVAATPPGHRGPVGTLAAGVLPDGRAALVSGGEHLLAWDADGTPRGAAVPRSFTDRLSASAWLPLRDGRVALVLGTTSWRGDGELHVWDPVGPQRLVDPVDTGRVAALTTVPRPDGGALLAVADRKTGLWCWDPDGAELPTLRAADVAALAGFVLDGRSLLAAGGRDRTVQVFDVATGSTVDCGPIAARGKVTALAALPLADGRTVLAVAGGRTIVLWDLVARAAVGKALTGHTDAVAALAAVPGPDGGVYLASAGADHTVRLWDAATGAAVGNPGTGHTDAVRALAAVPRDAAPPLLASGGDDGAVWLWEPTADGPVGRRITGCDSGGSETIASVPLPGGRAALLSASSVYGLGSVWTWDTADWSGGPLLDAGHCGPVAVVPMPDGRTLVATQRREHLFQLYDPVTGRVAGRPLPLSFNEVSEVATVPTPDGPRLAVALPDGEIRLYDPVSGTAVGAPLTGHTRAVVDLAVPRTRDGTALLASADLGGTVRVWDPVGGRCLSTLALDARVWSVAAYGTRLLVGCTEGFLALDLYPHRH